MNQVGDLPRVTSDDARFMVRPYCFVWGYQLPRGQRVVVDNRLGIREGEVVEITFLDPRHNRRGGRRTRIQLDPLPAPSHGAAS